MGVRGAVQEKENLPQIEKVASKLPVDSRFPSLSKNKRLVYWRKKGCHNGEETKARLYHRTPRFQHAGGGRGEGKIECMKNVLPLQGTGFPLQKYSNEVSEKRVPSSECKSV